MLLINCKPYKKIILFSTFVLVVLFSLNGCNSSDSKKVSETQISETKSFFYDVYDIYCSALVNTNQDTNHLIMKFDAVEYKYANISRKTISAFKDLKASIYDVFTLKKTIGDEEWIERFAKGIIAAISLDFSAISSGMERDNAIISARKKLDKAAENLKESIVNFIQSCYNDGVKEEDLMEIVDYYSNKYRSK